MTEGSAGAACQSASRRSGSNPRPRHLAGCRSFLRRVDLPVSGPPVRVFTPRDVQGLRLREKKLILYSIGVFLMGVRRSLDQSASHPSASWAAILPES